MMVWQSMAMAAVAVLVIPVASAQQVFENRAAAGDLRSVRVENIAGSVKVVTWDEPEIWFSATAERDVEDVVLSMNDTAAEISVRVPKGNARKIKTDVQVKAPPGTRVEIKTVSADIYYQGLASSVDAQSVSGNINLEVDADEVRAKTVSGDAFVTGRAGNFYGDTTSGNLKLTAAGSEADLESISGDLTIEGDRDRLQASTTSGNINASGQIREFEGDSISGDIRVETVQQSFEAASTSGNIKVEGGPLEDLEVRSISGDITYSGGLAQNADFDCNSKSANINITIPRESSVRFDLRSFSGNMRGDGAPDDSRSKSKSFQWGTGEAEINAESFSGDITIHGR
ncbi:MAG: DUF4097 family beta strand repeat protein [Candidatus Hydrogenedens sp.]|nr:DUF4097 family beta strand repeat protein [Candidatus Hydrogenedens sp.]